MYKILILLLIFLSKPLLSQFDSSNTYVKIDSVAFIGNNITEDFVILNELTFTIGDSVNYYELSYVRERIFSLGIFNNVELQILRRKSRNILYIYLDESWYIYPFPFLTLKDRDWNKLSYGVNLLVKNFRGRNETVSLGFGLGYDPFYNIKFNSPNILGDKSYSFSVEAFHNSFNNISKTAEQLADKKFKYKIYGFYVGMGKRVNLFNRTNIALGFNYVESPVQYDGINASGTRIDKSPAILVQYQYDTRNLVQFPTIGTFFNSSIHFKGLGINNIDYRIYSVELKKYKSIIEELNYKYRIYYRGSTGNTPYYDMAYIGYDERIRGMRNFIDEGRHLYKGSFEIYYPIIKEFHLNFDWIPIIPDQLLHYRLGIYSQVFTDIGTVENTLKNLSLKDFKNGFGAGITFLVLPYNILRIEVATEKFNKYEMVIDLGISF